MSDFEANDARAMTCAGLRSGPMRHLKLSGKRFKKICRLQTLVGRKTPARVAPSEFCAGARAYPGLQGAIGSDPITDAYD
jgi:hypothetical protein